MSTHKNKWECVEVWIKKCFFIIIITTGYTATRVVKIKSSKLAKKHYHCECEHPFIHFAAPTRYHVRYAYKRLHHPAIHYTRLLQHPQYHARPVQHGTEHKRPQNSIYAAGGHKFSQNMPPFCRLHRAVFSVYRDFLLGLRSYKYT